MSESRYVELDVLRGFAVKGILLMNIIAFGFPSAAYVNPEAAGGTSTADLITWAVSFITVEGTMRGLFSLLFGASMLLVITRAEDNGQSGWTVHSRRMIWLFVFGMLHFWFLWEGDILALYALCGFVAYQLRALSPSALAFIGLLLILANLFIWLAILLTAHQMRGDVALAPTRSNVDAFRTMLDALGAPGGASIANDLHLYQRGYWDITEHRLGRVFEGVRLNLIGYGLETLGLIAWGMALFKSGALTGHWPRRRLMTFAAAGYGVGLPLSGWLAWMSANSGFEPLLTADIYYAAHLPGRLAVMTGHLMGFLIMADAYGRTSFLKSVSAAGRMAFSNYILTSALMTSLFYGYGAGLFGQVSRAAAYLIVSPVWALMLLWSRIWLTRYRYGPLEWLWRSLSRGNRQAFRISTD